MLNFTWSDSDYRKLLESWNQVKFTEKVIFIFIAIATILGNTLVLVVTWKERSLHQPSRYLIACLAFADLLVGIVVEPLRKYKLDVDDQTRLSMSIHLCRFVAWIDAFTLAASIYSLTFISFDRYLKISQPLQYKSKMTTSRSLKIILIIWLISTAIATYVATPYRGSNEDLLTPGFFCPVDRERTKGLHISSAVTGFFFPTVVILIMYALIFMVVHKRQKMLRNGELGETPCNQSQRTVFLQDLKVIRMVLVVVGVFIFCWCPFFTYLLLWKYNPNFIDRHSTSLNYWRWVHIRESVIFTLPYFNSLCNPIIYGWLDTKYRLAFKSLFQRIMYRLNLRRGQPTRPAYTIDLPAVNGR